MLRPARALRPRPRRRAMAQLAVAPNADGLVGFLGGVLIIDQAA